MRHTMTMLLTTMTLSVFVESERYLTCDYKTYLNNKPDSEYWTSWNSSDHGRMDFISVHINLSNMECVLNPAVITDEFIKHHVFQGVTWMFYCFGNTKIHFTYPTEVIVPSNTSGSVYIVNCTFDERQINVLLELTNARYLFLQNNLLPKLNMAMQIQHLPLAFYKLKGILIFYVKENIQETLGRLFNFQTSFPEMREFFLSVCTSGTVNLTYIQNKFPNLTFLSVTNCSIVNPVELNFFHSEKTSKNSLWKPGLYESVVQKYLMIYHTKIPDYQESRGIELRSNSLQDSEKIRISGYVNYVKITNNCLPKITANILVDANRIQVIIFTQNSIMEIENATFKGQFIVEHLDLSKNLLHSLPHEIFFDTHKLKYLSIAYNKLEMLPKNIFSTLNQLDTLDLEGNRITNIMESHLPMNGYALTYINLNLNAFIDLPVSIFYIRGLKKVDLKYTNITFSGLLKVLESIDDLLLIPSISTGTDFTYGATLYSLPPKNSEYVWKIVDLTGSKVSGFDWAEALADDKTESSLHKTRNLIIVLSYFRFVLTDNPISCFSNDINLLVMLINIYQEYGIFSGDEYFFKEWFCDYPIEFRGRSIFDIKPNETYFQISVNMCPAHCVCFLRFYQSVTIVDCRNSNLSTLPSTLPTGVVDLWLQNNNISILDCRIYFNNVRQLFITNNSLTEIEDCVFSKMTKLEYLKVDHNLLSYFPQNIDFLDLDVIYIDHNPLLCDCNSLWLKHWMLKNILTLRRLKDITCRSTNGIEKFLKVPDKRFICIKSDENNRYSSEILGAVFGMAAMCLLTLAIVFRNAIKVLLYVKCGFHPFDHKTCEDYETIDITFIYSKEFERFIFEKSKVLTECNICYSNKDFIPGYSWDANIRNAVYHSKCVFILLTNDLDVTIINSTYAACEHKLKRRLDFLIGFPMADTRVDGMEIVEDLKRYFKLHQKLKSDSLLFWANLKYRLSSYKIPYHRENNIELRSNIKESIFGISNVSDTESSFDVFVSYSDEDQHYSENKLIKKLREIENFKVISVDQIRPGSSVFCSVETCVDKARHTIFVASNYNSVKQGIQLVFDRAFAKQKPLSGDDRPEHQESSFKETGKRRKSLTVDHPEERKRAFRMARIKTDEKGYNHLIVVFRGRKNRIKMDQDFEHYFQKYIFLEHVEEDETEDIDFWKRLQIALKSRPIANCASLDIVLEDDTDEGFRIIQQHEKTISVADNAQLI